MRGLRRRPACRHRVLLNDRYGRERIFLHVDGSRTYFASEAKAILAVAPRTRGFDPAGLAEFLSCGCTVGRHSLFNGIEVLEPGSLLTFDSTGLCTRSRYAVPADLEALEPVSRQDFLESFSDSLSVAVSRSIDTGPRVGVSLTGGLDSRMIMGTLRVPPGSVPCYTFGSMFRTTGDVAVARRVAAACGESHHALELGGDFLANARGHLEHSVYIADGYLGFWAPPSCI